MKAATIYLRNGALFCHSSSMTTTGIWIATAPFLRIESDDELTAKGAAALAVLGASQEGVAHPTNWSVLLSSLLSLAHVKTWTAFMKGAACVNLELESERLRIIPNINRGAKEGFEPLLEYANEVSLQSLPNQIGAEIDKAFMNCR